MVDYFILDTKLFIKGITGQPNIVYYADASKTVTVKLIDEAGNYVTDSSGSPISTSFSVVQGINNLNLGDWLDANGTYINDGLYALEISNGTDTFYVQLIVCSAGVTLPVSPDDEQYINKIIVYDKVLGTTVELPPTITQIPYVDRYTTYIYLYKNKLGRVIIYDPSTSVDTGFIKRAILTVTIKFNTKQDLINFLLNHTYPRNYDSDTLNAVVSIVSNHPELAPEILSLYGFMPVFGRSNVLDYQVIVDDTNGIYQVKYTLYVRIGDWWSDLIDVLKGAGAGAVAGAVLGTIVPGIGTVTGAVAGAVIGGVAVLVTKVFGTTSDTTTDTEKTQIKQTAEQGKQNITYQYNKAMQDLDTLHSNGEITDNAYNVLKNHIQNLYNTALQSIDEIVDIAVKNVDSAYNKGYQKGRDESKFWIIGAGLGGFLIGNLVKKI